MAHRANYFVTLPNSLRFLDAFRGRDRTFVRAGSRLRVKGVRALRLWLLQHSQKHSPTLPLALAKDSDAPQHHRLLGSAARQVRQEEGAQSPSDRARPGAGPHRGRRLRRVLVRQHRPGLLPADHGLAHTRGPVRDPSTSSATATASRRSTPIHRRGPVPGPGLRPGAGPLLGDGRPPPHDRRPALGDVRQGPGRDRRVPAHAGLAPGGAEGVRHQAVGRHEEVPPGLLRGRQRLPQGQGRQGHLPGVRGARPRPTTTSPRSGRRSTRWPGSRRWPGTCAATCRTRSTAP